MQNELKIDLKDAEATELLQVLVSNGVAKHNLQAVVHGLIDVLYLKEREVLFRALNITKSATIVANLTNQSE